MANEWKRQEQSKQFSAKGLANIRTGKERAKITFLGTDKKGNPIVWDDGEASKTFLAEDLPSNFVFEPRTEGEYFVCTSFDKSEVFSIGPWKGTFEMVVYDISRDKDTKTPTPFISTFKDNKTGKEISQKKFKILWKIVSGEFKGCIVSQMQVYDSEKSGVINDGNGYAMWKGSTKSDLAVWQPRLETTFDKLHVSDSLIPWTDDGNILPEVWKRIENSPTETFFMDVVKGEIAGFSDTQGKRKIEEDVDDLDEIDLPAQNKPAVVVPQRSNSEIMSEMGIEADDKPDFMKDSVDEVDAPVVEKNAKKAAKKVEDPDDL